MYLARLIELRRCIATLSAAALMSVISVFAAHGGAQTSPATGRAEPPLQSTASEIQAIAQQYFPSGEKGALPRRLYRLTRDQLDITAATLLPGYTQKSVKAFLPRDGLQTNYEYADLLSVNAANSRGYAEWVGEIAKAVRSNPKRFIDCDAKPEPVACQAAAAKGFVIKAFRGDPSPARLNQIVSFYLEGIKSGGLAQAAGDLVEVVLNSPHFIFRKEVDTDAAGRLVSAQLLQAVTYTLADAPPEKLGLDSGNADQYLANGRSAATTINMIAASPEAREKLVRFFVAWLELKEPAEFTISRQTFPEFTPKMAVALRSDVETFLRNQLRKEAPSLKDITQARIASMSAETAALYVSPATPAQLTGSVELDPAQRLGIFSQPAFIASHSGPTDERPIKRGVFWVRKAMCMEMEPPPKDLHAKLYDMKGATARQRIEQSTEQPACIGCHKIINPFSFFQDSYDALGRWRSRDSGMPIDTSIIVNFLDEEPQETKSAVDALKLLTGSQMFKQCFVRQLFRFYMGRSEEPSDDPVLQRIFLQFTENDSQDIWRAVRTLTSSDRIVKRQ